MKRKSKPVEEMELVDHLIELRARLLRILVYVAVGSVVGWLYFDFLFSLISSPVKPYLEQSGSKFLLTGITEGFAFKMQMALIAGIVLAFPLISVEGWMFVSPGLTKPERRAVYLVAPLSILLFVSGIGIAYYVLPVGVQWLISQNPPEATFMPSVTQTLLFILKMVLAFGLVFQMPVVLLFLAKVGLVNAAMLRRYWRHAAVLISFTAAIATPSTDAMTMLMMCIPMLLLYLLSIGLVALVQRKNKQLE